MKFRLISYFCKILVIIFFVGFPGSAKSGQNVALKTNLLYDATATANLGLEFGLGRKWSLDISGDLNVWSFSDGKRWKHWLAQPELRYWFCGNMGGHFLALHALGGQYNVGKVNLDFLGFLGDNFKDFKTLRHQGWYAGGGIGYGYCWMLGKHWNMELEIAVGYIHTEYDLFECADCGRKIESGLTHNYIGPTKLAFNIGYVF
ncbi:MAG: DUF3575 domain-containing protein [Muribaculaceae bacterium]|nr:DUF3575 domain-containing protein [Muribaculaceae bacterium]